MTSEAPPRKLDLSAKRRALMEALLREQDPVRQRIPRRRGDGPVPLSFAQERLWFLDQYYPNSPLYNIPGSFPLPGPLDVGAVYAALDAIVRRHEALRTVFEMSEGRPVQRVLPRLALSLPVVDLRALPETRRQAVAAELLDALGRQPFPLATGPLLRLLLVRLWDELHLLHLSMHHIVSDAWSMGVFLRELQALYPAFAGRRPASVPSSPISPISLPELPIQYPDFAVWQRGWLAGEVLESHLAFWRGQFDGAPPILELPTDRPRPAFLSYRGANLTLLVPRRTADELRVLSQGMGVTLFMVLLAGFKALLFRVTEETSLVVGFPSANRNRTEIEGLIGFFVNTLVLHTRMSGELSFRQLVARVREVVLGVFAHQDLPFEKLVEELQPARSVNANPLFQVMFDFHNNKAGANGATEAPAGAGRGDDEGEVLATSTGTSKFDLSLSMASADGRLTGSFEFSTDLFDRTTVRRWIGQLRTLLAAAAAEPDRPLASLPLMPAAERHQVRVEWNDTAVAGHDGVCLDHLFAAQAARVPDTVAAVYREEHLTYAGLERRANGLARWLRRHGTGPGQVVGLCLEGSLELPVAVLGVLAAGGTYLPLDPAYPRDRLAFMLEDARAHLLLTQEHLWPRVEGLAARSLALDSGWSEVVGESSAPLPDRALAATASDAAYVIYTSGTTGRPKGVIIPHRAAANLIVYLVDLLAIPPDSRVLQFSSFSFDISVREIFEALLTGSTLCLERREDMMPGEPLLRVMGDHAITTITLAPSVWEHLPDAPLPALGRAVAGGEACPSNVVARWAPGRLFFNAYGPTETTVASSVARCLPGAGKPSIGRPVANLRHYVVDRALEQRPVGMIGELMIGGVGVGRGYLRRPALTAERFIPDPFSGEPGARLYRTGDLARPRTDGTIDYLGRIDHQVKIRGLRIELGEIEAVLNEHPAVVASAVLCLDDPAFGKYLAGYVVAAVGIAPPTPEELQASLASRLPEYMVPQLFIFLDRMPMTSAGKTDRRALPTPDLARRLKDYVAPRDPVEEILAEIWAEVLSADRVGVEDNFFELGGHSLLVTQIVSRVRDTLRIEMPIRKVFEAPTVSELAASLRQDPETGERVEAAAHLLMRLATMEEDEVDELLGEAEAARPAGPAFAPPPQVATTAAASAAPAAHPEPAETERIPRRRDAGPAPLSFAQERLWFLDQFQPGSTAYNVVAPLPLPGPLQLPALERTLKEVAARHEILRTTFHPGERGPVQVVSPRPDVPLAVHDLQVLPPADRQARAGQLVTEEGLRPFDLSRGPLLRALLLRLAPEESLLVLAVHHIVLDAWSQRVLFGEIRALYAAALSGRPLRLPDLPIQYADFAVWQRHRLAGGALAEQLAWWRQQLDGVPALLDLPTDRPRPAEEDFRGAMEPFRFPAALSASLGSLAQGAGATLFMVLLAAFQTLLYRLTGQTRIVVGSPIANRDLSEIEPLIGLFTNTLVLPADFAEAPSFRGLLGSVREMTLGAFARRDLPFEKLVEALRPERSLNTNPLFQAMFVLQKETGVFQVPAAGAVPAPLGGFGGGGSREEGGGSKFDLTLYMEETGSGLIGGVEYAVALFDRLTLRRLIGHFEILLAGIAAAPDRPVPDLPLLSPAERHQVAVEWAAWDEASDAGMPVLLRFAEQAARTPTAEAVEDDDVRLTYGELLRSARRLARVLTGLGVGPEVAVGVCVENGPRRLTALLGVLAAGGAYLPLDPSFPVERLARVLRDARVPVVLTEEALVPRLPDTGARLVTLDTELDADSLPAPDEPLALGRPATPESAAYLIYTSGSTGEPKGIVLPHRTLASLAAWQVAASAPGLTTLQFSSPIFDVSLQEAFATWGAGGVLVCPTREEKRDPALLLRRLSERRIERLFLPFVALQQLAEAAGGAADTPALALREVITAGEQLKVTPALSAFFARLDGCRLANQYGPSETHVLTEHRLADAPSEWPPLPPIGRPVAGARTYVLDGRLQPVPVGVTGELYAGGAVVGRGYVNRPDLTASSFLPDPFAPLPGARMYRTGDRARQLADGALEFLGRFDQQVKIRGFRVETGEIEAVLARSSAVAAAAVDVRGGAADRRLVAWVVLAAGAAATAAELVRALRESLPDYMVPADFLFLESLPLTATGKVDRRRLPDPERARPALEQAFAAPRSPLERQIAALWSEVLGIPDLGVHDNFFDLGGHSLLATGLMARLRTTFRVELPLRLLFEHPTIADLALVVVESQLEQAGGEDLALVEDLERLSDDEVERLLLAGGGGTGAGASRP